MTTEVDGHAAIATGDAARSAAGPARSGPRSWRIPSWRAPSVVVGMALLVGMAARLWQATDRLPLVWQDSLDYLDASKLPLLGLQRWAGPRPVITPLLLAATSHQGGRYVQLQQLLAGVCWA
ncbi:MAG: hypothetical protein JWN46_2882, partial [Acidimicrobiales bacterium]|nr:hypothetical protein [Acidimicrobiales bacterium]